MMITGPSLCGIETCKHAKCINAGHCTGEEFRVNHAQKYIADSVQALVDEMKHWGVDVQIEVKSIDGLAAPQAAQEPVAWRNWVGGQWAYFDKDPREVHDNGKPCEPLYASPVSSDERDAARLDFLIENYASFDDYIDGDEVGAKGRYLVIKLPCYSGEDKTPDGVRHDIDAAMKEPK